MSISIQFHACVDEAVGVIQDAIETLGVCPTYFSMRPFSTRLIETADVGVVLGDPARTAHSGIALSVDPPDLTSCTPNAFRDDNPNLMTFQVGRTTDEGMEESCYSVQTEYHSVLLVARKVAHLLKKRTLAGATAYNPRTGATSRVRNHRYTAGALELSRQGVRMLPVAGTSLLRFE